MLRINRAIYSASITGQLKPCALSSACVTSADISMPPPESGVSISAHQRTDQRIITVCAALRDLCHKRIVRHQHRYGIRLR